MVGCMRSKRSQALLGLCGWSTCCRRAGRLMAAPLLDEDQICLAEALLVADARGWLKGQPSEPVKTIGVSNGNMLAFHLQGTLILEHPERAADRFDRKSQIVGDFAPGHGEVELPGREATLAKQLREVDQEAGNAFRSALLAQQHEELFVSLDLSAHHPEKPLVQNRDSIGHVLQAPVRYFADAGTIQCGSGAMVETRSDGVQSEHFTGKVETYDLFCAVFRNTGRLHTARSKHMQNAQRFAAAKNLVTFMDGIVLFGNAFETL